MAVGRRRPQRRDQCAGRDRRRIALRTGRGRRRCWLTSVGLARLALISADRRLALEGDRLDSLDARREFVRDCLRDVLAEWSDNWSKASVKRQLETIAFLEQLGATSWDRKLNELLRSQDRADVFMHRMHADTAQRNDETLGLLREIIALLGYRRLDESDRSDSTSDDDPPMRRETFIGTAYAMLWPLELAEASRFAFEEFEGDTSRATS